MAAILLVLSAATAFAQSGAGSAALTGVVRDTDGGVVPGATVTIKNTATGETLPVIVTNSQGAWSVPALPIGTYTVTIALTGFKTVVTEARLLAGGSNSIETKLEIGGVTEEIKVTAGTELVRTASPTVTATVTGELIKSLPRFDRNALSFVAFLPNVQTTGGNQSTRSSTVAGLPQNTINITIDGITTGNLLQSGDGFFSMVTPRLDAVEEVSMTTAAVGAGAAGQGSTQIQFVTKSGTNRFQATVYDYDQRKQYNTNTFFNKLNGLAIPEATQAIYGGSAGGPIVIPGLFDGHGKYFFFFNQENNYNPSETPRARTIIRESALNGLFTYNTANPTTVNIWALATSLGQINTYDPTIKTLLQSIRTTATGFAAGSVLELTTSPNTATFNYLSPKKTLRYSPTTNLTVNLTSRHRLNGSYYYQAYRDSPDTLNNGDPTFPGFPAYADQNSYRSTGQVNLRSTLTSSMVNEAKFGWQTSPNQFFTNTNRGMFENQDFFAVSLGFGLTNAAPGNANSPQPRNTPNWTLTNTFNWLRGSHSLQFGGGFNQIRDWARNFNNVPTIGLGLSTTSDPAELAGMFTTANFPGASNADLNNARALYALLTGRVTSIGGTARLNEAGTEYVYIGPLYRKERQNDMFIYAQDQWRWKPTLTINAGVRYQLQMPMQTSNGVFTSSSLDSACGISGFAQSPQFGRFCNMFNPGSILAPGVVPTFEIYAPNSKGYNLDKNNFAPNVGVAWRPNVESGFFRRLLGDPEQATINAGYSRSYNQERIDRFLDIFSGNPGQTITATRNTSANGYPLVLQGESWPLLFRDKNRLGPPAFPKTPVFPLTAASNQGIWVFDPDIKVPYSESWTIGLQRALNRDTAVELRYQGNRSWGPWVEEDWNVPNMYETGLLNGEFEKAQANLRANVLAGRGGTFAYTGVQGTSPLPIYLAHLSGRLDANSTAAYTGTLWTNATFVNQLDPYNPNPSGAANTLATATTTFNGVANTRLRDIAVLTGAYPLNFWQLNPVVDEVVVQRNSQGNTRYHAVVLEVRRRLSQGLQINGSYAYSRTSSNTVLDFHLAPFSRRTANVPHAIKMAWTYDVPVGRGKRFGANMNGWLDGVLGGWNFSGTGRFQRQAFVIRDAVLVGMTLSEAREALKDVRLLTDPLTGVTTMWNFPKDIVDNSTLAYNTNPRLPDFYAAGAAPTGRYFAPAGGPGCNYLYDGDCGVQPLWFLGRWFGEVDISVRKSFQLPGRARFDLGVEVFNVFLAKNFPNVVNPGFGFASTNPNIERFRITSTLSDARKAQLLFRVSW